MGKKVGPPSDVFSFAFVVRDVWIDGVHADVVLVGYSCCGVAARSPHGRCTVAAQSLQQRCTRSVGCQCTSRAHVYTSVYVQAWECLTAERPWEKCTELVHIVTAIIISQERLPLPSSVPAEMGSLPDLIQDCWQVDQMAVCHDHA